jgi:GDPmannose 4,6-dehydratase
VDADESLFRPSDITYSVGNAEKARRLLGWEATVDFDRLISRLVEEEKEIV